MKYIYPNDEYDARAVLKRTREDADVEEDGRRGGGGEGGARRWELVFVLCVLVFLGVLVCPCLSLLALSVFGTL